MEITVKVYFFVYRLLKIVIVPNLLIHYIKLDESKEGNSKQKIECIKCGFIMGEYTVCHLKCFKCGLELTDSE
jgi:hypothetical protein